MYPTLAINLLHKLHVQWPQLHYFTFALKISSDEKLLLLWVLFATTEYHETLLHPFQNALTVDFQSIANIVLQIISITNIFVRI